MIKPQVYSTININLLLILVVLGTKCYRIDIQVKAVNLKKQVIIICCAKKCIVL